METAIYIEDGVLQLVITPQTKHERSAVELFEDKQINAEIFIGSFYECLGGWIRQKGFERTGDGDRSLILKVKTD